LIVAHMPSVIVVTSGETAICVIVSFSLCLALHPVEIQAVATNKAWTSPLLVSIFICMWTALLLDSSLGY